MALTACDPGPFFGRETAQASTTQKRLMVEHRGEEGAGLTLGLVERALRTRHDRLPDAVRRVARDCLTDWLGCALAGLSEPASRMVAEAASEEGGSAQATLIGRGIRLSLPQAALANGTASHALDYDDVNLALPGHLGVAIIPGLLALAEYRDASAADFYAAFVAGYNLACRVGTLVEPAHYANGFHATATLGSLGAAVACAHLLRLPVAETSYALGIAATQAAGLKAMFGSMAKPLHAGLAAQAGVRSALLAQKGFVSRHDALECAQGFAQAHGDDFHVEAALADPEGGHHILNNIFKFHAACFSTHSTIEAVAALRRERGIRPGDVARIHIVAGEACAICNHPSPSTGLEAKFSLRAAAAFAMLAMDTARLDTWQRVTEAGVRAMLEQVHVELVPGMGLSASAVTVHTRHGEAWRRAADVGVPLADKTEQSRRVNRKFVAIAAPVVGEACCERILNQLAAPDRGSLAGLLHECRESRQP